MSSTHFYGTCSGSSDCTVNGHDVSHAIPFSITWHEFYARANNVVTVATNAPALMNMIIYPFVRRL